MAALGGGINVKMSASELVCLFPKTSHPPHLTLKTLSPTERVLALPSASHVHPLQFKYSSVFSSREELNSWLLSSEHIEDWFFQGFSLAILHEGSSSTSSDIFSTSQTILRRWSAFQQHSPQAETTNLSIRCITIAPRVSDNFMTEDITDLATSRAIHRSDLADSLPLHKAGSLLTSLSNSLKIQKPDKITRLMTYAIRITLSNPTRIEACHLDLIQLYENLFNESQPSTKFESNFQKGYANLLVEAKAIKSFGEDIYALSRASYQKTRLTEFLRTALFNNHAKLLIAADFSTSSPKPYNEQLKMRTTFSKDDQLIQSLHQRLSSLDCFISLSTLCRKFPDSDFRQSVVKILDSDSYNPITRKFLTHLNEEHYETNQAAETAQVFPTEQDNVETTRKHTFKEEMQTLLARIQGSGGQKQLMSLHSLDQKQQSLQQPPLSRSQQLPLQHQQGHVKSSQSLNNAHLETRQQTELSAQFASTSSRQEVEISHMRSQIQMFIQKLSILAEDKDLGLLIQIFEAEALAAEAKNQQLKEQINILSLNASDKCSSHFKTSTISNVQSPKCSCQSTVGSLKESIRSLHVELIEKDKEIARLKKQQRGMQINEIVTTHHQVVINKVTEEKDSFMKINRDLLLSLNDLNIIVAALKQSNLQLTSKYQQTLASVEILQDENIQLKMIAELSQKQSIRGGGNLTTIPSGTAYPLKSSDAVRQSLSRLSKLTLKTGSGIPESILKHFENEITDQFENYQRKIEFYRNANKHAEDFLLALVAGMESSFGRNDKHVKQVNKFVRDFLIESMEEKHTKECSAEPAQWQ